MSTKTGIEWTDHTFNPWWGCQKVSPGCTNCYAETLSVRFGKDIWGPPAHSTRRTFGDKHWRDPVKWNAAAEREGRRHRVFCASMADVFEDHPDVKGERERLWALIDATPWLDWQVLTKRPENVAEMAPATWVERGLPFWLGTSVEDQERADERIPALLSVPARVYFLSAEPLLGPVDLSLTARCPCVDRGPVYSNVGNPNHDGSPDYCEMCDDTGVVPSGLHWVIVGGESGPGARPMDLAWARSIVDQCRDAGVACFVKQLGAEPRHLGQRWPTTGKGGDITTFPADLQIREFPGAVA